MADHKVKIRKIQGKKPKDFFGETSSELMLPSFNIDLKYLPEAKSWKIGNTYEVVLHLKQTGIRESRRGGHVDFDIVGVGVSKNAKVSGKGKISRRYS